MQFKYIMAEYIIQKVPKASSKNYPISDQEFEFVPV